LDLDGGYEGGFQGSVPGMPGVKGMKRFFDRAGVEGVSQDDRQIRLTEFDEPIGLDRLSVLNDLASMDFPEAGIHHRRGVRIERGRSVPLSVSF